VNQNPSSAVPSTSTTLQLFIAFGRLELEWCERKILLGWLELELVAGVV